MADEKPLPPRTGVGVASQGGQPFGGYNEQDSVSDALRLLFPGSLLFGQVRQRKNRAYEKCLWAYKGNHAYSACVDLIAATVLTNGLQADGCPWRLVPATDRRGNTVENPDEGQPEPFYEFVSTCSRDRSFEALLKVLMHDYVMVNTVYAEIGYNDVVTDSRAGRQPAALWLLPQSEIIPQVDKSGELLEDRPFAQLRDGKNAIFFSWPQIFLARHDSVKGPGILPLTPVDKIEASVESTIEAEKFIRSYFRSGSKMGQIFSNPTWGRPQAEAFLDWIKTNWTDSDQGHQPMAVYDGTTVTAPPKGHNNFTEMLDVERYDVRKICPTFQTDPRLISAPSEGSLGGKGEREQCWSEFLQKAVNPRKRDFAGQFTQQILVQGFGITDWVWELVPFKSSIDEASRSAASSAYVNMINARLLNPMRLSDLNRAREQIDADLLPVEECELQGWPQASAGNSEPIEPDQSPGETLAPETMAEARAMPAVIASRRAPRAGPEKRTPFAEIKSHQDNWADATIKELREIIQPALEKSIATLGRIYEEPHPASKLEKANLLPGAGSGPAAFVRAVKAYYADTAELTRAELKRINKATVQGKRDITEAEAGDVADYLQLFGKRTIDRLYGDLVAKQEDMFLAALENKWSAKELVAQLVAKTAIVETTLETHVRTAATDFFNQSRRAVAAASGIVTYYEFSAIGDDRTTEVCSTLDGLQLAVYDEAVSRVSPPCHWNCRSLWTFGDDDRFETDIAQLRRGEALISPDFGGHLRSRRTRLPS